MADATEKRDNWLRKFCAIFVGLIVTGMILYILPGFSKFNKEEEKKVSTKDVKVIESIKEDVKIVEKNQLKNNVKITSGSFKRYRITLEIEFNDRTEIKKALGDFKKACFIIKSSPTIKKLTPIIAKGIKKKDGVDVEYDIELGTK